MDALIASSGSLSHLLRSMPASLSVGAKALKIIDEKAHTKPAGQMSDFGKMTAEYKR